MLIQEIENLLAEDEKATEINDISQSLLKEVDNVILRSKSQISDEVIGIYAKFLPMKQEAPEGMKNELFTALRNYIKEKSSEEKFADALLLSRFLIVKSVLRPDMYNTIAEILACTGENTLAKEFILLYEKKETNKPLRFLTAANFYNLKLKDYKTAIKYYEQYLRIDETKAVIYTILGSLYAKAYGDFSLKDQMYYFEKAYKLKPQDRLVLHSLAFGYEKSGQYDLADKYYRELLNNNPTETDYYNYGGFLIRCGDFKNGHKYLTHRFNIDDVNLKYPLSDDIENKWNFEEDISQKTLLVKYEQGFGDTFMYCRFVPLLKNFAKNVVFMVQKELYDLVKISPLISDGIEIIPDDSMPEYDVHMALIDVPYVVGVNPEDMIFSDGYLTVDEQKVKEYREKYIKPSDNIKVGISCQGNKAANYSGRDIDMNFLKPFLKTEGVDFYSFSMEEENIENLINLGKTFNDFTDTACALKCMDVVITADNVILNLAGALGVKTFAIFNKYPNFRWYKLTGDDVGWYKSVKPFQVNDENHLKEILSKVFSMI